ncbi:N-acetylmuramoyl-L-alanine amidase family protein [Haliangium ochraceum]|uniref:N-acetylmuramoyl-L-alanine amidase n=1 Tax=Haliangium ochraceum (strain DSM 14365 / JCM 11303 / SMP-2) TaxID=502025 RepID=D0LLI7_HALO1|nr:N-acetylmuramoyl-L-alanine amidase [Haliangium ochraceum]ACY13204.1 N-acetylmuramoyl-L-alanine amidase [Haliangium ochraceum DSM 14365]
MMRNMSAALLVLAVLGGTLAVPSRAAAEPAPVAPLVVIDPGHGGTNSGAPGAVPGLHEKQVTLAIARLLWRELSERGYRVVLTRDRDIYLTLRQRVRLANRVGADVFLSIHANATPSHDRRGYETFVLPPSAVDVDSRALRLGDGPVRAGVDHDTALLLDDLERGAALESAAALAAAVQTQMRAVRGPEGDRGVRQGAMDVLMGATMPAVLIEVGFIDHPVEGHELASAAVRKRIARALADAVSEVVPVVAGADGDGAAAAVADEIAAADAGS